MKKNNFKFNFVDTVIVVILAIAVVVLSVVVFSGTNAEDPVTVGEKTLKSKDFTYKLLFREIDEEVVSKIKKNIIIYEGGKNESIGKIIDFEVDDSQKYEFNSLTGEYINVNVPEKYDLTLTISAKGSHDKMSYFIDEYEIYVGRSVDIRSVGFVAHGYVVAVDER